MSGRDRLQKKRPCHKSVFAEFRIVQLPHVADPRLQPSFSHHVKLFWSRALGGLATATKKKKSLYLLCQLGKVPSGKS